MRIAGIVSALCLTAVLVWPGCGSVEETTESTDTWTQPTPLPAQTSKLEYRIDSLMVENRRLKQQVDAMAAETRSLSARNAELEMRLNEALAAPRTPPPAADMTGTYSGALSEYRRRNFSGAAAQFTSLLNSGVQEDLADNCHYWIGESFYGMGQFRDALGHFQEVFGFAHSEKKDDAQMMIGNCYLALRDTPSARAAFTALVSKYPTSPYVKRAQEKLASLQ
jgi:TolA-binding protein